ncbi:MAG: 2'-5' RNA ligase family protein [Propionibacteriaceae bacterium]|nr:2'-5' RNA ligase family protein [Propionibacteriaceae bacterium]
MMPAADPVIDRWRQQHDTARQAGVPAHLTLIFPFALPSAVTDDEMGALRELLVGVQPFTITLDRTDWFGDRVLFLGLADPAPLIGLIHALEAIFPDWLPYGGAFEDVWPHVTMGSDGQVDALREAEAAVASALPIVQKVNAIAWWVGSPLDSGRSDWHRALTLPLGA